MIRDYQKLLENIATYVADEKITQWNWDVLSEAHTEVITDNLFRQTGFSVSCYYTFSSYEGLTEAGAKWYGEYCNGMYQQFLKEKGIDPDTELLSEELMEEYYEYEREGLEDCEPLLVVDIFIMEASGKPFVRTRLNHEYGRYNSIEESLGVKDYTLAEIEAATPQEIWDNVAQGKEQVTFG